jgi:riboflavin kinase / FMN adenylyltransferase
LTEGAEYDNRHMRIIEQITALPQSARGATVALGNFDGIHRGHQVVIGEAQRIARAGGTPSAVMTFNPHPRRFFDPEGRLFELTPADAKKRHLAAMGIDILYLLRFDATLATMPAEKFVTDVLVSCTGAVHVVVGYDFVFGRGRKGNAALLQRMGADHGFGVTVVPAVQGDGGLPYSSTRIRDQLRNGHPRDAAAALGRWWEVEGAVQTGDRRGRQIGFPTANVDPGEYVMPALGVYAVWVGIVEGDATDWRQGVVNVGRRPTFAGEGITVEAHIFDFDGDLYGRTLRVAFVGFLRPEMKFDGIDAIRAQIEKDCAAASAMLEADAVNAPPSPPQLSGTPAT